MKSNIYVIIILLFSSNGFLYCQRILMDDFHAPHTYARWQPFIDTLEAHGVEVDFTTDLGFDINVLLDFDVVWIIHPRRPLGGNYIKSLRDYLRSDNKKNSYVACF